MPQGMLAWLMLAMGLGQVAGNAQAGRAVDRHGARRTLIVGLAGALAAWTLLGPAVHTGWAVFAVLAAAGLCGSTVIVPQQHRLFGIAPDAPTVALGLNGSAIYLGAGLGAAVGGTILDSAGSGWLPWTSAFICGLALAVAMGNGRAVERTPAPAPA